MTVHRDGLSLRTVFEDLLSNSKTGVAVSVWDLKKMRMKAIVLKLIFRNTSSSNIIFVIILNVYVAASAPVGKRNSCSKPYFLQQLSSATSLTCWMTALPANFLLEVTFLNSWQMFKIWEEIYLWSSSFIWWKIYCVDSIANSNQILTVENPVLIRNSRYKIDFSKQFFLLSSYSSS